MRSAKLQLQKNACCCATCAAAQVATFDQQQSCISLLDVRMRNNIASLICCTPAQGAAFNVKHCASAGVRVEYRTSRQRLMAHRAAAPASFLRPAAAHATLSLTLCVMYSFARLSITATRTCFRACLRSRCVAIF